MRYIEGQKKSSKGRVVNVYLIGKMLDDKNTNNVLEAMKEKYKVDIKYERKYRNLTFDEYLNEQRSFLASVLGLYEFY